jgi:proline-specific peptidase
VSRAHAQTQVAIRDVSLCVDVVGQGYPLLLMHGGPSADHWSLLPLRQLADQFKLIFYDHRCNGRSVGAPVSTMTWENLTADADALRQHFGFERWAVLGHSFGGFVALEYALRYPDRVSQLVLLDTGADSRWARENAPALLARRGDARKAELVRRWFTGDFTRGEYFRIFTRIGDAYFYSSPRWQTIRHFMRGMWRVRIRPEALIFAGRDLLKEWTVVDRLGEITIPTLVMAGRDDFVFPPEAQEELTASIPHARLKIIERAGHNSFWEQPTEALASVRDFLVQTA